MIFPDEYKNVGVTESFCPGTEEPIYFLTDYLIVKKGDPLTGNSEYAIYRVKKSGEGLLRKVEALETIASGEEVVKYDRELNIKDRALLIETAEKLCTGKVNTVIFTGVDKHVTFVHKPDLSGILELEILDVAPPYPSWLSLVIRRLEASGIFGDLQVRFTEKVIDLRQFEGKNTVFPCSASGLEGKCLDSDVITENGHLLVGCEISKTLFEMRFPELEYSFVDICPFKSEIVMPSKPFITRCCRSENSGLVKISGFDGAVVHWGASEYQVAEAVRNLVKMLRQGSEDFNRQP
ncbi:MAG: hypothetical protein ACHQXK_07580 [Methanosarcina thermophila]|mgnify:FL=1|jgi:hypothetical protein|uniref:Uncharacterized protein n=3 Tax=Methanosarcina thermophila TaxID=2210 RepID=A0A1I7BA19_METTE|nr:hypothetical protein [Methanosarcina thermophila]ALK05342.1 MAG: hypothetical protein AAY43_06065 [Methanosarcina sp. 795]AKB14133.1 hypothetical protein MSTHT_2375 [Methanosarcina thermophila TM-1]AKB15223.1 hypothetical protein MSTHC_0905 [Methanosarcina thermophila CHTI-55]NLU58257.1 hypothetical protein [Methanosarcina thermophila]SFT84017.1 hypothetical protein SAMN02910340_02658 [Methanosarcina thermophila]